MVIFTLMIDVKFKLKVKIGISLYMYGRIAIPTCIYTVQCDIVVYSVI